MIVTNIILACLMMGAIGVAAFWAYRSRQSYKLNTRVATELDGIITNTLNVIKKNKELTKQKTRAQPSNAPHPYITDLESPEMLSTIVTVLVNKYGDVTLSMDDFMIPDSKYVSVYVDTNTQQIILSMDHQLETAAPYSLANYGNNDDNTFH